MDYKLVRDAKLQWLASVCLDCPGFARTLAGLSSAAAKLPDAVDEAQGPEAGFASSDNLSTNLSARSREDAGVHLLLSLKDIVKPANIYRASAVVPVAGNVPNVAPDGVDMALTDDTIDFAYKMFNRASDLSCLKKIAESSEMCPATPSFGGFSEFKDSHVPNANEIKQADAVPRAQPDGESFLEIIDAWDAENLSVCEGSAGPFKRVKAEPVQLEQPPHQQGMGDVHGVKKERQAANKDTVYAPDVKKERPPDPKPGEVAPLPTTTPYLQGQATAVMKKAQKHIDAVNRADEVELFTERYKGMWKRLDPTVVKASEKYELEMWTAMFIDGVEAFDSDVTLIADVIGGWLSNPPTLTNTYNKFTSRRARTITELLDDMTCKSKEGKLPCKRVICMGIDILERGLLCCASRFAALIVGMMVAYPAQTDLIDMLLSAVVVVTDTVDTNTVVYYIRCETASKGIAYVSCKDTFVLGYYVVHELVRRLGLSTQIVAGALAAAYLAYMTKLNPVDKALHAERAFSTNEEYTKAARKENEPDGVFLPTRSPACRPNGKTPGAQNVRGKNKNKKGSKPKGVSPFSPAKPLAPPTGAAGYSGSHIGSNETVDDQPFAMPVTPLPRFDYGIIKRKREDFTEDPVFALPKRSKFYITASKDPIGASSKKRPADDDAVSIMSLKSEHSGKTDNVADTPLKKLLRR